VNVSNIWRLNRIKKAAKYVNFQIDNQPVAKVKQFKCIGCIITDSDNNLPAVERQITKSWATWGRIGKIIGKKIDANPKMLATFIKP
jgi:hypothetical protein